MTKIIAVLLLGGGMAFAQVDLKKLSIKSEVDFGHVVKGYQAELGREVNMLPLNRNTVTVGTRSALDEVWKFEVGLRGIIWWPFGGTGNLPHERIVRVEPGLAAAKLGADWGALNLELGYFPYKYNHDAKNLGEYLHRSGTYPGFLLTTENWQLMNGATPYFYGAHAGFTHSGGMLSHDFTLFFETEVNPIGDLTPGYELSLNLGLLEIGGGVSLNHYLSFHPSELTPDHISNIYVEIDSIVIGTDTTSFYGPVSQLLLPASQIRALLEGDTAAFPYDFRYGKPHWSHKGIKIMSRTAIDFGQLLPEGITGPEDLRLFGEIAILGLEDRKYYYENKNQRIPVMVGFNFPTFNFLNLLSFQVEHYGSPYNNSVDFTERSLPVWTELASDSGAITSDDWKWSLNVQKKVNKLLTISAQVANDHIRTLRYDRVKNRSALTQRGSHWYYLAKLEMGI